MTAQRLGWIDQARGFSIFLVVYGHNFPNLEGYIYSFHVPLFFFISGMFHPKTVTSSTVLKRAKMIVLPYFCWAFILYGFWYFIGRHYGKSALLDLSPLKNVLGIFYGQGGREYMDWGIPIWFLLCLFVVFIVYSLLQKIKSKPLFYVAVIATVSIGFLWSTYMSIHLPWSIDVAFVAISFYAFGNMLRETLPKLKGRYLVLAILALFIVHLSAFYFTTGKVDMYRSTYGMPLLFIIAGVTGSIGYILLFKALGIFKFLAYLGTHSITILAAHTRVLTVLKFLIMIVLGIEVFEFTEIQKRGITVLQIALLIPIIWFINRYIPILDGKFKKSH